MIIVKLWHYIRGYVIINMKGRHLERLINLIHHNNILIWDIIKINPEEIKARIELKDFKQVVELSNRLSCDIELLKKSGLTLWKWRLQTRKIFVAAFVLVFLAVFFISSLVLTIEVKGDANLDKEIIVKDLEKIGVKPWVFKNKINFNEKTSSFLQKHKEIEFMSMEFNGTKLIVDLVERELKQNIYDKSIPVDLIAKKDGIIKDILVINGTANVEINQKIKKGDLLVKGEVVTQKVEEEKQITYIHAMAKVMAQTSYSGSYEVREYKVINKSTYKTNRILHIGSLVINFLDGEENYYYDSSKEFKFKVLGKDLPIKIDTIKYYAKDNCVNKTKEELEKEVIEKAKEEYKKIGQVQNVKIGTLTKKNNIVTYKTSIIMIEDISEEQKIEKEE